MRVPGQCVYAILLANPVIQKVGERNYREEKASGRTLGAFCLQGYALISTGYICG